MKPSERYTWVEKYLKQHSHGLAARVSVVDSYFVDDYISACGPKSIDYMPYGAHRVPQLGRDLAAMYKEGKLVRNIAGLGDMHSMGFPAWVYEYKLKA